MTSRYLQLLEWGKNCQDESKKHSCHFPFLLWKRNFLIQKFMEIFLTFTREWRMLPISSIKASISSRITIGSTSSTSTVTIASIASTVLACNQICWKDFWKTFYNSNGPSERLHVNRSQFTQAYFQRQLWCGCWILHRGHHSCGEGKYNFVNSKQFTIFTGFIFSQVKVWFLWRGSLG